MAGNKKPRKRYNPNKLIERIVDKSPLTRTQQTDLGLIHHVAFESMLKHGNEECWYVLSSSMNVALVLAEQGYGEEFIPDIKAAMEALMDTKYRADRTGRWLFDGDGIKAMRTALTLHDQQCQLATRAEIKQALQAIVKRANEGYMYAMEDCRLEEAA